METLHFQNHSRLLTVMIGVFIHRLSETFDSTIIVTTYGRCKPSARARILLMPGPLPIACSLDGDSARRRWHEWSAVIARRRRTERSSRRLAVYFAAEDDSWAKLSELVAAERLCCGFVTWELKDLGAELMLAVGGDSEGVKAMAESFGILGDR